MQHGRTVPQASCSGSCAHQLPHSIPAKIVRGTKSGHLPHQSSTVAAPNLLQSFGHQSGAIDADLAAPALAEHQQFSIVGNRGTWESRAVEVSSCRRLSTSSSNIGINPHMQHPGRTAQHSHGVPARFQESAQTYKPVSCIAPVLCNTFMP